MKAPTYLHSLLTPVRKPLLLRSSSSDLSFFPEINSNIGTRDFSVAAPTLWDKLHFSVISVEKIKYYYYYYEPLVMFLTI